MRRSLIRSIPAVFIVLITGGCGTPHGGQPRQASAGGPATGIRFNADARHFRGDPLAELEQNISRGDYQFRGLRDLSISKQWVPGVDTREAPVTQVVYTVVDSSELWMPAAESYLAKYNQALAGRLQGRQRR